MYLRDIISVKGSKGLFRLLKVTRNGLLLETLDKEKKKVIKNINFSKATPLDNIAIYSKSNLAAVPLKNVFEKIYSSKVKLENIELKTPAEEIKSLMKTVMPDYDEEKLHPSQIIKIITWYKILIEYSPEIFKKDEKDEKIDDIKNEEEKEVLHEKTLGNEKKDPSTEFIHPKEPINEINNKVSPHNLIKTPVEKDNHKDHKTKK